jgi:hypothetical protein
MFKKPLGLLGIFLIVVGIGYFVGAGVAYSKVQGGYGSLQSFSEVQNVQLNYNEDGQLIDRGQVETAQAIMSLLEDDWSFPVVDGDMDPNDPLVNTASEYMYQMATISYHVLNDTQMVTLTQEDIDAAIASEQLAPDGTYEGSVAAYQGQVLEPGSVRGAGRGALLDRLRPGPTFSTARLVTRHGAEPPTHWSPSSVWVRRRTAPCSSHSESPHCSPDSAWSAR